MNWKNLFRFTPRAGREEFATVGLLCNLLTFGNLVLSFTVTANRFALGKTLLIQLALLPVSIFAFWVGLALYSRRLHDFNLSLWWYILYVVVTTGISVSSRAGALAVSALGVAVWAFLALKKSPAEENRFGKAPEPFFPALFQNPAAFYLTAVLGILVALSMAGFSKYSMERMQPVQPHVTAAPRF